MSPQLFSLICAAFSVAFLWPSEGAINGDGLPWVLAWAVVAALIAFGKSASGQSTVKRNLWPVLLLVAGFWLSTWYVFRVEGDRRAALNLAFEWTAIGLACWCIFRLPVQHLQQLPTLIVALGLGISVLGILQYHVANQRLADWYRAQTATLDASTSAIERQAVEGEFQRRGIPVDAGRRELFERRLLDSSEPTGPFALANTFGGVLAVVFVFLIGGILNGISGATRIRLVSLAFVCLLPAVVGYCLILTKSRTAWVGCVAGVLCLFAGRLKTSMAWGRKAVMFFGAAVFAGLVGVASGAIDREVVLESPKSLQYRLFYWTGAAGVIQESPLFGAGPGNFRQAYLAYKVPESSEEILDPHNVFIDAWCSAGLVGFIGLLWMTMTVAKAMRRHVQLLKSDVKPELKLRPSQVIKGIAIGTIFYLGLQWMEGASLFDFEQDVFRSQTLLLVVPLFAGLSVRFVSGRYSPPASSAAAAFVCLMVHLLGAGGLQITVVGLLMVVCYSIATSTGPNPSTLTSRSADLLRPALPLVFSAFALAVVWYGIKPCVASRHHLEVAGFRKAIGDQLAALDSFESAIAADPLFVDSRQQKAEYLAYEFSRSVSRYAPKNRDAGDIEDFQSDFAACVESIAELIRSDRRRMQGYYLRSQLYRVKESWQPEAGIHQSIADMQLVVDKYPTNVRAWAELAILRQDAGVAEADVARDTALELESINRSWGHIDRYLADDVVSRLKTIDLPK